MPVTAKFIADFTSFYDGVNKAESELRDFQSETNKAATQLSKVGSSLSSTDVVAEVDKINTAVEQIGTTTQATDAELAKVATTAQAAATNLATVGEGAPEKLKQVTSTSKEAAATLNDMKDIVKDVASAFGIGFGIKELIEFGKALFEDAGQLMRMSNQTGLTLQALQKFTLVGNEAGNSIDEITAAVTKLEEKMASGDKSARKALDELKIDFQDFQRLSPENKFIALSDALRQVASAEEQVGLAMELGGKQMVAVLPTLKQGFDDVRKSAVGMSDDTIRAMDTVSAQFANAM